MEKEPPQYPRVPLGKDRKAVRISGDEMHLAYLNREATGEPIQTWIRRLIRENAAPIGVQDELFADLQGTPEEQ